MNEIWIDKKISDIIPIPVLKLLKPFNFNSIYDLGNKKTNNKPYSIYYKEKNIEYNSIDINGKDGALKLDLTKPINLQSREMVSNIGTSEHVTNQEAVFKNIHNLSNFRIVHWVPVKDKRKDHGYYGYTKKFFKLLAELNYYEIEKLYYYNPRNIICCSYRKTKDLQFKWDEELLKYIGVNKCQ